MIDAIEEPSLELLITIRPILLDDEVPLEVTFATEIGFTLPLTSDTTLEPTTGVLGITDVFNRADADVKGADRKE